MTSWIHVHQQISLLTRECGKGNIFVCVCVSWQVDLHLDLVDRYLSRCPSVGRSVKNKNVTRQKKAHTDMVSQKKIWQQGEQQGFQGRSYFVYSQGHSVRQSVKKCNTLETTLTQIQSKKASDSRARVPQGFCGCAYFV